MNDDRVFLTFDQAVAMLPDGDDVHTFRSSMFGLVGADWTRADVLDAIKVGHPELAGEFATSMGHGLVIEEGDRPLFIATKEAQP